MEYKYPGEFVEGKFVSRPNRFIAEVELDGEIELAHVKNTGRMVELLLPGATVYLQKATNPNRKTKYDLISIVYRDRFVNLDSQIPNTVGEMLFRNNMISGWENPDSIKREVTVEDSRLDLCVEKDSKKLFVEIKGVDLVPSGRAMFPDAPTTRGVKHLNRLIELKRAGHSAMNIYIIARDDAVDFRPHKIRDPEYAEAFYKAKDFGVEILAFTTINDYNSIKIDKEIPIISKEEMEKELENEKLWNTFI